MNLMDTEYNFTDRERLYFDRLQQNFNTSVMSSIQMIVTQQALDGQWRIKQDGSGLERADVPQPSPEFKEIIHAAEASRKANGLAD